MTNSGIGSIRKKVTKTYECISTSYHEAGHTVYGLLHFIKINLVNIHEDKKHKRIYGDTYYYHPDLESFDSDLKMNRIYAEIGLSYAGLVAEKRQFRLSSGSNNCPLFIKDKSSQDTTEASNLIKKYELAPPGRKRYEFKKKKIKEVGYELQDNWDAVTIIAHALFQRKQLNFADLRDLLTKKTNNRKFWKEQFRKMSSIYMEDGSCNFSDVIH